MSVFKFRFGGMEPPAALKTYKNEVNKFFTIKRPSRLPPQKSLPLQKNSNWLLFG